MKNISQMSLPAPDEVPYCSQHKQPVGGAMKIEEAKTFIDYAKKKGIVSQATVNNWNGALVAVAGVLDDEEKTIDYVLTNGDVIKNRLQNQSTDMSGSTIGLYIQRSQSALKNFLEWKRDRAEWEKAQASKPKVETVKAKKEAKTETSSAKATNAETSKKVLPIPTSGGDSFEVALPENYVMADLVRVVWALAVYAKDFDPATVLERYGKPPAPPSNNLPEVIHN
jgi:hypothetical protein